MKRLIILSVMLTSLVMSNAHAKRMAPAEVKPVKADTIEYRAPRSQMGCIEAWDTATNELIWRRQIYVVKYGRIEKDVQDVFIKTIILKGDALTITNERNSEYQLNLKTLEVKVLKGSLIEAKG